jgi:hypothetical protein
MSAFGGANNFFATQKQARELFRDYLAEHEVSQLLDFAIAHPLRTSRSRPTK